MDALDSSLKNHIRIFERRNETDLAIIMKEMEKVFAYVERLEKRVVMLEQQKVHTYVEDRAAYLGLPNRGK